MLMYLYHTWRSGLPWQRMIKRNRCIFLRLVALLIFFSFVGMNSNCIISDVIYTCIIVYMHVDYELEYTCTLYTYMYCDVCTECTCNLLINMNIVCVHVHTTYRLCTCTGLYLHEYIIICIHIYTYTCVYCKQHVISSISID